MIDTNYNPKPLEDKPKWYETKTAKLIFMKLGIVTWVVSTIILAIIGFVFLLIIHNSIIGLIVCMICWIIAGTSAWIFSDFINY